MASQNGHELNRTAEVYAVKDLNDLRHARAKLLDSLKALNALAADDDNRDLTAEEQTTYDEGMTEIDSLTAQIKRGEDLEALDGAFAAPQDPPAAGNHRIPRPAGPEAPREFESLGEFVSTIAINRNDPRLASLFVEGVGVDMQAEQTMGDGSSGGFAVPTQFVDTLLLVEPQDAIVRPRANVIPAGSPPDSAISIPALDQTSGSNAVPNNVFGGVTVNWTGEGATMTETDADLREVELKPHEMSAYTTLTEKLMRNWVASGALIERLLRQAVVAAQDLAFLRGDGIAKPLGFQGAGAAYNVNRTTTTTIVTADIDAMVSRILMRGGSPIWIASQSTMPKLRALKDDNNVRIWNQDLNSPTGQTLAGHPLMFNERSPQLGSKGDLSLADLSYYLIKDGSGPFIDVGFATGDWEANKRSIKIISNVDGQPWLTEPWDQEGGYEVSPFINLDVPSA